MARLWSCGFELQSVISGVECQSVVGSPSISTAIKRSGLASMRCNVDNAAAYISNKSGIYWQENIDSFGRFYLRIATAPGGLTTIARLRDDSANRVEIKLNSDRTLELWDGYDNVQIGSDTEALDLDTWYRIEFAFRKLTDRMELYIDGVQKVSADANTLWSVPTVLIVGVITSATCDLYFDDLAINDSSGSYQTGYPGAGSIVHIKPNAAGDNAATAGLYSDIDEITPNNDTDYIQIDVSGVIGDYNLESSLLAGISAGDAITLVQVGYRTRGETKLACSCKLRIKGQSGGTVQAGPVVTHSSLSWYTHGEDAANPTYQLTAYVNPQDGAVWEPSDLDSMQIGVEGVDTSPHVWITTLWALVEYVPAEVAGPAGVKTINDLAIASVKTINDTVIASVKTINDSS